MKIAVIGAGSWGTALASQLGHKHDHVALWVRKPDLAATMEYDRQNKAYLPDVILPSSVTCTADLAAAAAGAELIILAVPSHAVRQTSKELAPSVSRNTIVVSAAKGLEAHTFRRMSEIIVDEIAHIDGKVAVLSGPNHAEEVGRQQPTASVVASASREVAEMVQDALMLPYFRVYTNPDIIGVELGGALKNIIALGAGIAEGLGYGDNSKAALMTRGLAEITRMGVAMGAQAGTFAGLTGIGDLMVTCTSRHSRNRRAGMLLAQGRSARQIQDETNMVVEGFRATAAAYELAGRHGVRMPITEQTWQVIYQSKPPRQAVLELMTRSRTHESEELPI